MNDVKDALLAGLRLGVAQQMVADAAWKPWSLQVHEYLNQTQRFQEAYDDLADDLSRRLFLWCVTYRTICYFTQTRAAADDLSLIHI